MNRPTWSTPRLIHVDISDCNTAGAQQTSKCTKKNISPSCQTPNGCKRKAGCNLKPGRTASMS